ncbi:hypothetical protein [Sphingobium aromaticiconvertens]|uniref:hypothetical protein n=1 Tax=Sphingobium aromaticiconvertens TaxID=365341 RepID=UPI0030191BB9
MSFLYDIPTDTIVAAEDGGLIATPEETVDPEDSLKMAAAPELFDALGAIYHAHQIGELPLPAALAEAASDALRKASPPWDATACDAMVAVTWP